MECSQRKQKSAMDLHNEMNWRMISGNVQWNESKINCIASERQARPIVDSAKTALSESDSRQEKKLYRMHVEKSPLKINEKQTYFNEKHKKTTTLKKQLIWPFNRENLTLTWTKFLFCSSVDIVPSAAMECWHPEQICIFDFFHCASVFTTTANPRSSRSSVSARVIFLCLGIVHWFYFYYGCRDNIRSVLDSQFVCINAMVYLRISLPKCSFSRKSIV